MTGKSRATRAAIVAILLIAAFLLNPGKERHDRALRGGIERKSAVAGLLGGGRVAGWLSEYHNLGIASYTEIQGSVRTYGALGIVIVR
jgi:hypothetical protein